MKQKSGIKYMMLSAIIGLLILSGLRVMAQYSGDRMPMIGEAAPVFKATTTHGEINFPKDYSGSWVVLFSHPSAFTPVCTSEFMEMEKMAKDFSDINCALISLSTDGLQAQYEWVKTIRDEIEFKGMKDVEISFPIIADSEMKVAKLYGMIHPNISKDKTVRTVFIIDPEGMVRAMMYYPISNGRNTSEIYRLVKAIQTTDEYDVATPADWKCGQDVFIPPPYVNPKASKDYNKAWEGEDCPVWFMCMKKLPQKKEEK